ncbi:ornithine carbamoyltransferase [uncultured Friedmanniella sp.]|uniref:ornithine carbamoyltransferase n=1 Tax=uncultured Friedmanniella sp. TaxID=335381 RepID=UPI0035CA889E
MSSVRHFLADDDLSVAEQAEVLALAAMLKTDPYAEQPYRGPRSVAVLFDKPTLRTQTSFAAGIAELGGYPMIVDARLAGIGVRESVADTARVLGRQAAAIVWRTFAQADLEQMADYAGVPVVNALTDAFHPCQILADLLTITEHKAPGNGGRIAGLTLAYVGDGANNMATSYLIGGALAGLHVRIGAPAAFSPSAQVLARAGKIAAATGGSVSVSDDVSAVVAGADVVATDTWVSMGQEAEMAERVAIFAPYGLTTSLLAQAAPDAIVLHCLPAYRGKEIEAAVLDGPQAVVWDEAENRRHVQKAVLVLLDAWSAGTAGVRT